MKKFGRFIAKQRILVLIIATVLLVPAIYGTINTRINYSILDYVPAGLDSTEGQKILSENFTAAESSMLIVEGMETNDILKLKNKISNIENIKDVIWIDDLLNVSIPDDMFPDDIRQVFFSENSTILLINFEYEKISDETHKAIDDIRKVAGKQSFLSGVTAIVKDTKDLSDRETPFYILIAVVLSIIVLAMTMKSTIIPFIFLVGIGFAVLYNMGTNIFLGEISYITKAIAGVLQLGVTMDYSIFLLHRYDEEREKFSDKTEAMAEAISKTIVSISGSSLTTIAGFLALCAMQLTLGKDIGIVMAKGVLLGVICTITVLPALLLIFDKPIHRFSHRTLLPTFEKTASFVTKKYKLFIVIFLIAFIPSIYGKVNTGVYYNLDESLPRDMKSIVATNKLKEQYNMITTHFILISDKLPSYKVKEMVQKMEKVDGIEKVIAADKYVGPEIPEEFIPEDIKQKIESNGYKLILANSKYKAARAEENAQIEEIISIAKSYDKNAMITGEGPLTKDLIKISETDFKRVSFASILAIFLIILLIFGSVTIPVILVMSIELAIFINMGIPFYTGTTIPFIASIVIGCIQLGATVDYAILMTTRFREELRNGHDKFKAAEIAVKGSARSIVTSALTFFVATFGVSVISDMELIKALCFMMSRGAVISMVVIVFVLPSILLASEKLISVTTRNWKEKEIKKEAVYNS
ncbi:efflux RND transporter permease subunit [Oceanirhabdus sp. W0125-5]|uniref:efflux RND transporter permease subunit n=1 Tax=Oceanirhabdus sp. W0125-5 TaxID=2999116 RepID=UPI0022F2EF76|nr:efflux RND transporter permease subunit [Oceanirhabdus sp. W0125-5]WBW96842.1 efflux RND transporter permease subunit [Oceanirhabdus sp. W0125-5]